MATGSWTETWYDAAWRPIVLAAPGLTLAVAGLFHPTGLSYETSSTWFALHVPGLLVFPLVGWALADLVHARSDLVARSVRLTALVYATFYTALDVISGIGAGYVTRELGPDVERPRAVSLMFGIGTPLGEVGSWALLACSALVVADQVRRHGAAALLGLFAVAGAVLVHTDHIFAPFGVLGMAWVGAGTAALAVIANRSPRSATPTPGTEERAAPGG